MGFLGEILKHVVIQHLEGNVEQQRAEAEKRKSLEGMAKDFAKSGNENALVAMQPALSKYMSKDEIATYSNIAKGVKVGEVYNQLMSMSTLPQAAATALGQNQPQGGMTPPQGAGMPSAAPQSDLGPYEPTALPTSPMSSPGFAGGWYNPTAQPVPAEDIRRMDTSALRGFIESRIAETQGKTQSAEQRAAMPTNELITNNARPQTAPRPQLAQQSVPRLEPKMNMTFPQGGKPSINVTPPTEAEQQAHQAQFVGAMDWLQANPHVGQALGPQMLNRLRSGDPKALEQIIDLQKNPAVTPRVQDLVELMQTVKDPREFETRLMRLYGDPVKAAQFSVLHPPGSSIDVNQLKGDVEQEVRALNAEKGMPQTFTDAATYRQAQNNVLARQSAVRQETTDNTLARMDAMLGKRAQVQIIARTAEDLTKKLAEDASFLSKGQQSLKYMAQAGDMLRTKGGTGIRPIDQTMRQFLGYMQAGKQGEAVALMEGWGKDLAALEMRFMTQNNRGSAEVIKAIEANVPKYFDSPRIFNTKVTRLNELFGTLEKQMAARQKAATDMLKSNPHLAPAADALSKGLYDVSNGYLKNLREQSANEPVPQVNFGNGDFAPGGK